MNALLRRGACPALAAPMKTGDGLLIRLSPVSGGFSPKQLIGLCESAARNGNGIVEVTARGSCQFRGFSAVSASRFAEDVDALAIDVRTGVPVEISPLAGMDPLEIGDSAGLAQRIRSEIERLGLAGRLGPKVTVVVDGGGQVSLDDIAADVRLTAGRHDSTVLWRLALACDAEAATQFGRCNDAGAIQCAITVLGRIAEHGREARVRDFAAGDALNRLRSTLLPSVPPDISPTRGEIGSCDAFACPTVPRTGEAEAASAISPLVGEMSGGREGGDVERKYRQTVLTVLPLTTGYALPISLPFGHIDATVLIDFAHRAETLGINDIRPALHRTLLPVCPSLEAVEALREYAQKLGFVTEPSDIRKNIAACPGAPACASGNIAARDIAEELARSIGNAGAQNRSIHISGCEKGCARQAPSDITIVGGENGAGLVVHGTTKSKRLAYRSAGGLAKAIAAVAAKVDAGQSPEAPKAAGGTTKTLSPAQLACLKAAFEQDGR